MFQLAVLSDDRPLAKCLDSITVDDLEQHTRQPPTDGAHPLLKPDQVLLVAASERIANDCGGGGYPHRMRPDRSPFVPDLFDDELRLADIDAAQLCSAHITVPGSCSDTKRSEEHTSELQSLMRISYAVFSLKKQQNNNKPTQT